MVYNITNISESENVLELTQALNTAVDNNFSIGILILVYIVPFVYFLRFGTVQAHLACSFITTVVGFLLFFMQLITWEILAAPIALLISAILLKMFTK